MTTVVSSRTTMMHMIGASIAVIVALVVSRLFGQEAIGWGATATIMAVSAHLAFVPKEKRNALGLVVFPVAAGIAFGLLLHYFA